MADDWRPPGPRDWKCHHDLTGTSVHIRPRNDLIWHPLNDDCPCGPATIHIDDDGPVHWAVIHYALDGRNTPPPGHYAPEPGPTGHHGECDGIAA